MRKIISRSFTMNRTEHAPTESQAIRQRIRRGEITGHTSGLAPGCVQGNDVILREHIGHC